MKRAISFCPLEKVFIRVWIMERISRVIRKYPQALFPAHGEHGFYVLTYYIIAGSPEKSK